MLYCGNCGMPEGQPRNSGDETNPCAFCKKTLPVFDDAEKSLLVMHCPRCGRALCAGMEFSEKSARCPGCRGIVTFAGARAQRDVAAVPETAGKEAAPDASAITALQGLSMGGGAGAEGPSCAICQWVVSKDEQTAVCPECGAAYHKDCWEDNQGCAAYGCPAAPETEHLKAVEIPISYWGKEEKKCPGCGRKIQAAAIRCRLCGVSFDSMKPLGKEEYSEIEERKKRLPAMRKKSVAIFVFSILPITAPLAALIGYLWYRSGQKDFEALPALYGTLVKVGMGVGAGQTLIYTVMVSAHSFLNAGNV